MADKKINTGSVTVICTFPNRIIKSIGWIPWLKEAMKDVIWLRYVSGRRLIAFDPEISE